jgi:secondary thiamine-phosphate synthase enzyme
MEQIQVSTSGRQAFHDITAEVQAVVGRSGMREGVCFIFCPHTTAGLTLNENWDPDVQRDLCVGLDAICPSTVTARGIPRRTSSHHWWARRCA